MRLAVVSLVVGLAIQPTHAQSPPKPTGQDADRAGLQAAYDATPNGGTITVPGGRWPTIPPFGWGWSPRADRGKSVLWDLLGPVNAGTSPVTMIGDDDLTRRFVDGHLSLGKQIVTGAPDSPDLVVRLDNRSHDYKPYGYGSGPDLPALQIDANSYPGSTGQLNGLLVNLRAGGNNPWSSEEQGINVAVFRIGHNSTWAYNSYSMDMTGRPPDAFATIGSEIDLGANGPDDANAAFDAARGGRAFVYLAGKTYPNPAWSAAKAVAPGATVQGTNANGVRTVYVAMVAGTTGPTEPAWPTLGEVADGGVRWAEGEPWAATFGRVIWLDGGRGSVHGGRTDIRYGSGLATDGVFQNAVIDASLAGMDTAASAGVRLGHDMPVDFSGDGTAAGRNRHTLRYADSARGLVYGVDAVPALVIGDDLGLWASGIARLAADPGRSSLRGAAKGFGAGLTVGNDASARGETDLVVASGGLDVTVPTNDGHIKAPALVVTRDRTTIDGVLSARLATPASSHAPCQAGDRLADMNYVYVCVARDTWKRAALSAF